MTKSDTDSLLRHLEARFNAHMHRHPGLKWSDVQQRLKNKPKALLALQQMETTGGEPDVVLLDPSDKDISFVDCAPESPVGRRSCCYDAQAQSERKENKPAHNAVELAQSIGIELLTESQYAKLQSMQEVDLKTSSWLLTPSDIRTLGGALFGDRRYNQVFTYHNGAQSYYAAGGFRGVLWIAKP